MRIAIIGSRTFNDYPLLTQTLAPYQSKVTLIVSGGAKGADSLGEYWAKQNNIKTLIFMPDWEKHGKKAGFIRNEDIIKNSDGVIAFWDGISKGTAHSISLCEKYNKPVKVVTI